MHDRVLPMAAPLLLACLPTLCTSADLAAAPLLRMPLEPLFGRSATPPSLYFVLPHAEGVAAARFADSLAGRCARIVEVPQALLSGSG
jgi:hypothetical protein